MTLAFPRTCAVILSVLLAAPAACVKDDPERAPPGIRIDAERFRVELAADDYAKGGDAPLVTIVSFTDFACPPCGRLQGVLDHMSSKYGDDLRVVYRAYTVPGFARGEQAAEAAFAAGAQGKFWEMHARLFAQGGNFDRPSLRAHAETIGLDVPQFLDDLDTGAQASRRIRDRRQAVALGITGLPATFVNGLYIAGFIDENTLHGIVDEEIKRARQMLDDGVPRAELYATIIHNASNAPVAAPQAEELRAKLAEAKAKADASPRLVPPAPDRRYRVEPGPPGVRGNSDAPVVIVAFVDFQCPFCRRAWREELEPLLTRHGGDVALAVRELPLEIHPAAEGAAKAALAASKQGKFWEFHDRLLAHEGSLGRSEFVRWVGELGMDEAAFLRELDSDSTAAAVANDVKMANAVGVDGTPGFFVNGRYVGGFKPGQLTTVVDEELAYAKNKIAAGTPKAGVFAAIMAEAFGPEQFPNREGTP